VKLKLPILQNVFCRHCRGNLAETIDEEGDKEVKCIMCGRVVRSLVPGFVVSELERKRETRRLGYHRNKRKL